MSRGGHRENAGRKPSWNHAETQTIRVPKAFAAQLLEVAKRLDRGESVEFVTESKKNLAQNQSSVVTKSKLKKESVTESNVLLSGRQLANRLNASESGLRKARSRGVESLSQWTQQRDPEGKAWGYQEERKQYYPIL